MDDGEFGPDTRRAWSRWRDETWPTTEDGYSAHVWAWVTGEAVDGYACVACRATTLDRSTVERCPVLSEHELTEAEQAVLGDPAVSAALKAVFDGTSTSTPYDWEGEG